MRIAIGSDHHGLGRKGALIAALEASGHMVLDLGASSAEPVDYPDYARKVGQAVLRDFVEAGVLVCGSGVGAAMAANKIRGVRAAPCADVAAALESRQQLDANVLCLSAQALDDGAAIEVTLTWIGAKFSGDEAHARQVAKVAQLEAGPVQERAAPPPTEPQRAAESSRAAASPAIASPPATSAAATSPPATSNVALTPPATVTPAASLAPAPATVPVTPGALPLSRDALAHPVTEEALAFLESHDFLDRFWVKDVSLWRGDAEAVRNRLGWLTSPTVMRGHVEELRTFANEIRRLQFSHVVVLGTGGSSRAARAVCGVFRSKMGFPDLFVLDSPDPTAVKHILDSITLSRTLVVVSSKSGTTPETLALYAYFRKRVETTAPKSGLQFIAITDPGTPLEALAAETGFRRTFLNASSIGGRYSPLSFFGLVPAALMGADVKALVERSQAMVERCGDGAVRDNPAVRLGAALAALARAGRNKVTLVTSEAIRSLGPWIEQLLAESLGKDGQGIVPVVDEPLGNPAVYGGDRVFVVLVLDGDTRFDDALAALDEAGQPVIRIGLADPLDVGAEFFRWEMATATAAAVLGVNPFDEPDVGATRERTAEILSSWRTQRRLPMWPVAVEDAAMALLARSTSPIASVAEGLAAHLAQAGADDYVAILSYLPYSEETGSLLQALRVLLRDRLRVATTVGLGPEYLHATDQLHKGGRNNGLFIQITGEDKDDLTIPGVAHGFATLKAAQAQSDLETLHASGRRVIRLRLAGKAAQGLQELLQVTRTATRRL
jgi:RpiB/LacA/LacB family sugar-phosphate isomerase